MSETLRKTEERKVTMEGQWTLGVMALAGFFIQANENLESAVTQELLLLAMA